MDTTHARIHQQLEAQLDRLVRRVGRLDSDLRSGHEQDWEESAVERENDEVIERLDASGRLEVAAIKSALLRLENGTYDRCSKCGQTIDPRRLAALPVTTTCLRCSI